MRFACCTCRLTTLLPFSLALFYPFSASSFIVHAVLPPPAMAPLLASQTGASSTTSLADLALAQSAKEAEEALKSRTKARSRRIDFASRNKASFSQNESINVKPAHAAVEQSVTVNVMSDDDEEGSMEDVTSQRRGDQDPYLKVAIQLQKDRTARDIVQYSNIGLAGVTPPRHGIQVSPCYCFICCQVSTQTRL